MFHLPFIIAFIWDMCLFTLGNDLTFCYLTNDKSFLSAFYDKGRNGFTGIGLKTHFMEQHLRPMRILFMTHTNLRKNLSCGICLKDNLFNWQNCDI